MARPKAFEPEQAVAAATELFWRKGYHTTSLKDLEDHLSIGRKSLYDTFGDKRGLFLRALDLYMNAPYPVSAPDAGWHHIEQMFRRPPFFDEVRPGCLLANTTLEFGVKEDPEVASRVRRHLARLERRFARALRRAREDGVVPACTDVPTAARFLTMSLQGLAVTAKAGASLASMQAAVDHILASVRGA